MDVPAAPSTAHDPIEGFTHGHDVHRLVLFSDAVFAIAITLLALEIHVPELPRHTTDAALLHALRELIPNLCAYALSFALIGSYWWWHHGMCHYLRRYDGRLAFLNLLFLAFVALVPFPAAVYGHFFRVRTALVAYTGFIAATGAVGVLMWRYATANRRLVAPDLDERVVRYVTVRGLGIPLTMLGGLIAVLFDPAFFSVGIFAALIVVRLLRRRVEKALRAHA